MAGVPTPRSRDREGLSSGISQRNSFIMRRAASTSSLAAALTGADEAVASRKSRHSEVPRKNSEIDYLPVASSLSSEWGDYLTLRLSRARASWPSRLVLLGAFALLCLPAALTALHDAHVIHQHSRYAPPGLLDFSLQHLRASHLRSKKALGGLSHMSNFGCTASAVTSRLLVLCDPTTAGGLACDLAAATGAPYVAVSPPHLHQQIARLFQVMTALPHLHSVVFIGEGGTYEDIGTLEQVLTRFPGLSLAAVHVSGASASGRVTLLPMRHVEGAAAPSTSLSHGYSGRLPIFVGAPAAITFRRPVLSLGRSVALLLPSNASTLGVMETALQLLECLSAVRDLQVVIMAQFSLAFLAAQLALSRVGLSDPVASSSSVESVLLLRMRSLPWVVLHLSVAERELSWRALHAVDAVVLPHQDVLTTSDTVIANMALCAGTQVIAASPLFSHPDLLSAGVRVISPGLMKTASAAATALALEQALDDPLGKQPSRRANASSDGLLDHSATAVDIYDARSATRREYDAWYSTAVRSWRNALLGGVVAAEPPLTDVLRGRAAGGDGAASSPSGPSRMAAVAAIALYASELAPVSRGGAGVVTTAVALELLCGGSDVVVIAPMPCSRLKDWRAFALTRVSLSCPSTPATLSTHCTEELLSPAPSEASLEPRRAGVLPPGGGAAASVDTWATAPFLWPWHYAPSRPHLPEGPGADKDVADFLMTEVSGGFKSEDLAGSAVAASAVSAAYNLRPFAAVEFFDFFGPAFVTLARRVANVSFLPTPFTSYRAAAGASPSTAVLPPHVRVLIRAHGTMEAIDEIEQPGPPRVFDRARHLMERFALAAADVVLLQTLPVLEQYVSAYGIDRRRAVFAPPPMARIMALFHPPQHQPAAAVPAPPPSTGGTLNADAPDVCAATQLSSFPSPCAGRNNHNATACAVFLSIGKLQRIKGPLVMAAAFSKLLQSQVQVGGGDRTPEETHFVMVGGDADCDYGGGGKRMSQCVMELMTPTQRRWLHLVPALPAVCVDAAIAKLGPVAVVFGSEFETFHLAAHEVAALQLPVILPDLPVYSPLFPDWAVYRYTVGSFGALARVMSGVLQDWRDGRRLRRAGSIEYGDALQPYRRLVGSSDGGDPLQQALHEPPPLPPHSLRDATGAAIWHLETAFSDVCNGRGRRD